MPITRPITIATTSMGAIRRNVVCNKSLPIVVTTSVVIVNSLSNFCNSSATLDRINKINRIIGYCSAGVIFDYMRK